MTCPDPMYMSLEARVRDLEKQLKEALWKIAHLERQLY
jgi:hypothetical protein